MQTLTSEQHQIWQENGYLHLEDVLNADDVAFFTSEIDRIRQVPGYEPADNPDLPRGHYAWLDHARDRDSEGFMDHRDLFGIGADAKH